MLQIYVYGEKEQGFLDLDPEASLDIEALSAAWDEDLSNGEFSIPTDAPWTDRNKRLLGFAERLENSGRKAYYWRCDVYENGFPELLGAKLSLLEKAGSFSFRRGRFNLSISSTKGLFGTLIKGKKLKDLNLGGKITWADKDSRQFAYSVMTGGQPQYNHIAFAPVAIEDFIVKDRPDYTNEFLAKDTVNNIVISGSTWTFGRPKSNNPSQAAAPGEFEYKDYRTIPFFRLKYVFRKAFEEFGHRVTGAFLDDAAFDDLFLFNNFAIEQYAYLVGLDANRSITPANHMPDMGIFDFIKSICQLFCCYPVFGVGEVKLVYRKKNFTERKVLSLNGIVSADFTSTMPVVQDNNGDGYTLQFQFDSNDSTPSDKVKDLSGKTLVATVARRADLAGLNIGRQLTTDDIALVEAENLYYVIADATTNPKKWSVYSERLDAFVSGSGGDTIDISAAPLCQHITYNEDTGLSERQPYLAARQKGSYTTHRGNLVQNSCGLRLFFIQLQQVQSATVPVSFYHNRDANNNKILPYSLSWKGADGLAENFHRDWQQFKQNAEIVKTTVLSSPKVLADMTSHNIYEVDGVLYLPYQVNRSIPAKQTIEVQMVPM